MSHGVHYAQRDNRNENHGQHGGDDNGLHRVVLVRVGCRRRRRLPIGVPACGFVNDDCQRDDEERVHCASLVSDCVSYVPYYRYLSTEVHPKRQPFQNFVKIDVSRWYQRTYVAPAVGGVDS